MGEKKFESAALSYTPFEFKSEVKLESFTFDPFYGGLFKGNYTKLDNKEVVNIKDYIINENATIIFWEDGTKTVVKKTKEDKFDKRIGLLIGYFQKNCGMSKTKANKFLDNLVVTEKTKKEK